VNEVGQSDVQSAENFSTQLMRLPMVKAGNGDWRDWIDELRAAGVPGKVIRQLHRRRKCCSCRLECERRLHQQRRESHQFTNGNRIHEILSPVSHFAYGVNTP